MQINQVKQQTLTMLSHLFYFTPDFVYVFPALFCTHLIHSSSSYLSPILISTLIFSSIQYELLDMNVYHFHCINTLHHRILAPSLFQSREGCLVSELQHLLPQPAMGFNCL